MWGGLLQNITSCKKDFSEKGQDTLDDVAVRNHT